jgi:HAD superfamily hydrolase (TIGR01509 family)
MTASVDAVLFDLDGTLTDTERVWEEVLDEEAAAYSGTVSAAAHAHMVGLPMRPSIELLHHELGIERSWTETATSLMDRLAKRYRNPVPLRPGAREILARVRTAGMGTALVTATERMLVELILNTLGRSNFDVIVTGTDVTYGKPDPEPYRRALAGLGLPASRAVAIEDSQHGTASATAAGIRTVVVRPIDGRELPIATTGNRLRAAITFVDSLEELTIERLTSFV